MTNEASLQIEALGGIFGPFNGTTYPSTVALLLPPPRSDTILKSGQYAVAATSKDAAPQMERLGTDYICRTPPYGSRIKLISLTGRCANQQFAVNATIAKQATTYLAEFKLGVRYVRVPPSSSPSALMT